MKKAIVTGATGQDSSYLIELLLDKGYEVHGMYRRSSTDNTWRIKHLLDNPKFFLDYGDLTDTSSIDSLVAKVMPDEFYNLGAQSHVGTSFKLPEQTSNVTGMGVIRCLDAIRRIKPDCKFYQASSSEMFGEVQEVPQKETTPFHPRSPYGCAKNFGYWATVNYREAYDMFTCNGLLFNHESPRRGDNFVTMKIVKGLIDIFKRRKERLYLGNINSKRDWGYAGDYVEAMWTMLQHDKPGDYVIAMGETHTVKEFVEETGKLLGMNIVWIGKGLDEKGIDDNSGDVIVEIDPQFFRPSDVNLLIGDSTKAKEVLGWEPKHSFKDLVELMVSAEMENE